MLVLKFSHVFRRLLVGELCKSEGGGAATARERRDEDNQGGNKGTHHLVVDGVQLLKGHAEWF